MAIVLRRAFAVTASIALLLCTAQAVPLSSEAAKCQKTVATQGRVFVKKRFGALQKCHDAINKGTLPASTDCTLDPKTSSKISKATTKYSDKVGDKCPDAVVAGLDFGGQCLGVGTAADLVDCLLEEHETSADDLIATVYPTNPAKRCSGGGADGKVCTANAGCPGGTCVLPGRTCDDGANDGAVCDSDGDCPGGACLMSRDQAKCAKILGKTMVKQVNKRLAFVQKCKKLVAKDKLSAGTDCVAFAQDKIDKITGKAIEKVQKKCPDAVAVTELFGGACAAADDADSVAACGTCAADSAADDLIVVQHGTGSIGGSASAMQIADSADCVDGPQSRCRVGDYLLANDQIRVVVQDIQRNYLAGIGQFGGQIIDADLVRTVGDDRDSFEEWAVSLNIESTAHYTSITVLNDGSNGGPAVIRATGVDDLLDLLNPSSTIADFGFSLPPSANDFDIPVTVQTDYILEPGNRHVRVETTVQNTDAAPLDIFFGEFLNGSGQVELFQSGYGFGEPLLASPCANNQCNRMGNMVVWSGELDSDGVSYAYVSETNGTSTFSTSGVTVPQLGIDILFALIGLAAPNHPLAPIGQPGDNLTFTRHFFVGDGSVASIVDARNVAQCVPFGTINGTVDVGGSPVSGADVALLGAPANGPGGSGLHPVLSRNVVTHARTDASGNFSMTVPPGDYTLVANLDGSPYQGGGSSPQQNPVTVTAFDTTVQNVTLPTTGALRVTVVDENASPIAARVSVVGFDPSKDPGVSQSIAGIILNNTSVFGDTQQDGFPHGVALATFADHSGDTGEFPLEPGNYRVYVSHGTEYSIDFADVTITAGATTTFNGVVEHVIDTTGFISGDFHVHSIDSPDAAISRADRVVSMLGEGVDFFATTDHGYRSDFGPTIAALGASGLVSTTIGQEITTFDYGHFNAWPLDWDPLLPNHGFIDHGGAAPDGQDYPSAGNYSETPASIVALAHADYSGGSNTVQINHVHSHFGLDGGSGLAIDTGLTPPASTVPAAARRLDPGITNFFTDTFDALEIWIGDSRGQVFNNFLGQNAGDWLNLINQGIVSTGLADSDTHRRFITQSGFPRSMVASLEDDPGLLDQDDVSANVNDGRVVGTNGPMIRVTAHAASTGQSGGLDLGRCTGVVPCTDVSDCPPCTDNSQCGIGETCTALPTLIDALPGGTVSVTVDIQSPTWAPFDTVEFYVNTTTTQNTTANVQTGAGLVDVNRYSLNPDFVHVAGVDFTVASVPVAGTGSNRFEASTTLNLAGLTADAWVVVMVSGTDGVSEPLFPVVPNSISTGSNTTLADLIDGNLNESGITARAFTNPIFISADGVAGFQAPGVQIAP
jgi:hypothetical protein